MGKLSEIIKRKKNEAILNAGYSTTPIDLKSGLRIRMKKDPDGYTVYLSRPGMKPPSEIEIKTFIENWPAIASGEDYTAGVVFKLLER